MLRPSDKAWIALGIGVLAWDMVCPDDEMLSEASRRYAKSHRIAARAVVASVALHLIDLLPPWVDPIHRIGRVVRGLRSLTAAHFHRHQQT